MENIFKGILNALDFAIVFVNVTHIITFMNKAAIEHYKDQGGENLVGKSIFSCHNEKSKMLILDGFKKLQNKPKTESLYFPLMSLLTSSTNKNLYFMKGWYYEPAFYQKY